MNYLRKHWRIVLLIIMFIFFMVRFQHKMPKRNFADFHVNYVTAQRLLSGLDIYDDNAYRAQRLANFKYPPLIATIFAPFGFLSERTAATLWFIFNFILLVYFFSYSGSMIFDSSLPERYKNIIYFSSFFLTLRFHLQNFDEGQVNYIMMSTLLFGVYAAHRNRSVLSGCLLGFSSLMKYMSVLFIPYFFFKRRWKVVVSFLVGIVLFSLLPGVIWGWGRNVELQSQFIPFVCKTSLDFGSLADGPNQSLAAAIVRYTSDMSPHGINLIHVNQFQLGFLIGCCYMLLYVFCMVPASLKLNGLFQKPEVIDYALLFVCVALFNPNAWMHAFIFLAFPYMVLLYYLIKNKWQDRWVLSLLCISFFLHSCTNSFFTSFWAGEMFEVLSFVTFGALSVFVALCKIKFNPLTASRS